MKKPPKVKGHWLLGSVKEFGKSPIKFVEKYYPELGEYFLVDILLRRQLHVTASPEVMRHLLQANNKNYIKDRAYQQLKLALGEGLLMNEGEPWKRQRRLAQPAFYKKRLQGMFEEMVRTTDEYCRELEAHRNGEAVNMLSEMMDVTSRVVLRTLLGSDIESELGDVEEAISESQKYIIKRIRKPYWIPFTYVDPGYWKFQSNIKKFDKKIHAVFARRRQEGHKGGNDLLSMLMEARDEEGQPMSDQQLRDEVITIFVAGHETSANALSWTFYQLCQHPEIYQKVKTEVKEVLGDRLPSFEDIGNLRYTRMVLDESMRLYPPAHSFGRQNVEADEILGYPLEPMSFVFCSIWMLHRRPDLWPDPLKFDPERFRPELVKERSKWHYMPFGAGPRMCIGNNFALMEIVMLIAVMMQRFDFVLDKQHKVEPEPLVTLRPKYGLKIWVK